MFGLVLTLLSVGYCAMESSDEGDMSSSSDSQYINLRNVTLKSSLINCTGLNICHFNAASIFNKMDEMRNLFDGVKFDIIAVTESWLKPHHSNKSVALNGYKCFRNDRVTRGGGIVIYVRETITANVIKHSECSSIEYLFLELRCSSLRVLFSCIYNSHGSNDISCLLNQLSFFSPLYSNIVVTGDFNLDLLDPNKFRFISTSLSASALKIVPRTEPTRYPSNISDTAPSLLDYFVVSDVNKISFYGQISSGFSDHDIIYISYNLNYEKLFDNHFYFRDFKNLNLSDVLTKFYQLPWNNIYYIADIDDKVDFFNGSLQKIFDECVPLKRIVRRSDIPVWFNNNILKAIEERDIAQTTFRRNKTLENQTIFRRLRNKVNLLIRLAKKSFWETKLSTNVSSKRLWKNITELGFCKDQVKQ